MKGCTRPRLGAISQSAILFLDSMSHLYLYIFIIYLVAIISGSREFAVKMTDLFMIGLALIVGCLSGMLGINL